MPEEISTIADASRAVDAALESGELASPADDVPETKTPQVEEPAPEAEEPEADVEAEESAAEETEDEELVDVVGNDGQIYRVSKEVQQNYITDLGVKAYFKMVEEFEKNAKGEGKEEAEDGKPKEPTLEEQLKELQEWKRNQELTSTQQRMKGALDGAISSDKFLKDHPELHDLARRSALATIHADTRLSEEQAVRAVAKDFAKAFEAERKNYVTKKAKASLGGEGGGGGTTVTPAPKGLSADDLLKGRIGQAALKLFGESG